MHTNPTVLDTQKALEQEWLRAKARDSVFSTRLMNNPAWDLVLRVAIGKRVSLSDLTNDATASSDSLSRWVDLLIDDGIMKSELEKDSPHQRKLISLSEPSNEKIQTYLKISENKYSIAESRYKNLNYGVMHEIRNTCFAVSGAAFMISLTIIPLLNMFLHGI